MTNTLGGLNDALPDLSRLVDQSTGGLADAVRDLIEESILDGRLPPGTRINASALASRLGLSHIPVREALRSLGADGWIDFRPHAGAFVCAHSERELVDIFESRAMLESESARLAALRRSPQQLDALEAILVRQRGATDAAEVARLNADFHVLVAECSQNEMYAKFVRVLSLRARFYFAGVVPVRRLDSIREHSELVDALRRRDPDRAATIARTHVGETCESVLEHLKQASP